MSPSRRRQAVRTLQDRSGLSGRRACRYVGQHRSTQRHDPRVAGDDAGLRAALRQISRDRPRWGYRRAHQLLLDEGWVLNRKRTQRLWREEGQCDQTADGRILKLLHVVDEFTREALAIECHRRIDADKTVATLERLVDERGSAPVFIRSDNGPELTANAIRDWCRVSRAGSA